MGAYFCHIYLISVCFEWYMKTRRFLCLFIHLLASLCSFKYAYIFSMNNFRPITIRSHRVSNEI